MLSGTFSQEQCCKKPCSWGLFGIMPQPIPTLALEALTEEGDKGPAFFSPLSSRRSSCGPWCLRHVSCLRSPDLHLFTTTELLDGA